MSGLPVVAALPVLAAEVEPLPWRSTLLLGLILVGGGAALVGIARRAAQGRLARNPYAGIRLKSTLASDEAWTVGHRAAARPLGVAGVVSVIGGLAVLVHGPALFTVVALLIVLFGVGGAVAAAAVIAGRAARTVR